MRVKVLRYLQDLASRTSKLKIEEHDRLLSPDVAKEHKVRKDGVEYKLVHTFEGGDHSVFVGEVIDAGVRNTPTGRPDDDTLTLRDLGDKVFYGG